MAQAAGGTAPALVAQRFVEAFNARDEQALRKLYHPDARIKRPTWPSEGDVAASLASIQLDFGAYLDGQIGVRKVVVQDEVAVVEFQFEGKNAEPLTLFNGQEIPATGRPLRLHGTIVLEVGEQGLIGGERQYWEMYPWWSSGWRWVPSVPSCPRHHPVHPAGEHDVGPDPAAVAPARVTGRPVRATRASLASLRRRARQPG